jgi:hypothetical protein
MGAFLFFALRARIFLCHPASAFTPSFQRKPESILLLSLVRFRENRPASV